MNIDNIELDFRDQPLDVKTTKISLLATIIFFLIFALVPPLSSVAMTLCKISFVTAVVSATISAFLSWPITTLCSVIITIGFIVLRSYVYTKEAGLGISMLLIMFSSLTWLIASLGATYTRSEK